MWKFNFGVSKAVAAKPSAPVAQVLGMSQTVKPGIYNHPLVQRIAARKTGVTLMNKSHVSAQISIRALRYLNLVLHQIKQPYTSHTTEKKSKNNKKKKDQYKTLDTKTALKYEQTLSVHRVQ